MEKIIFVILCSLCVGLFDKILASEIPVLMWTNKGGVQFPVSLSGHTLGASDFNNGYLDQIIEDADQNVAVFLQDKLSLEDITIYGDVYNDKSDGAVFSSVKGIFETYESTHLPSVKEPAQTLLMLQKRFKGNVHIIQSEDERDSVPLDKDTANLIVVHLPKTTGQDRRSAFKNSDEIIGKLTKRLAQEDRPFSALYTAHESSVAPEEEVSFKGRHLLADADPKAVNSSTYSLFKIGGCVLLYFTEMTFAVSMKGGSRVASTDNATFTFPLLNDTTDTLIKDATCDNQTKSAHFTLDFADYLPKNLSLFSMTMTLNVSRGYWMVGQWTVSYTGSVVIGGNPQTVNGSNIRIDTNSDVIYGTLPYANPSSAGYSYFCGNQPPIKQYERNVEVDGGKDQVEFTFQNIQMQFMTKNDTFGPPNRCSTFFSGAIWSSIVVIILMTMILAFAVTMIMNITTMDRFDDPKGKTIQVNVSE